MRKEIAIRTKFTTSSSCISFGRDGKIQKALGFVEDFLLLIMPELSRRFLRPSCFI